MEVINYIKLSTEQLEQIIIEDITTTKKLNNYHDIKKFMDKINDLQNYLKELKPEIKPEIKPEFKPEIKEENKELKPEIKENEENEENEENDKYLESAKKRTPKASEKTHIYEAGILRKYKTTHEENEENLKPKKERVKKFKELNTTERTYEKMINVGSIIIKYEKYSDKESYYLVKKVNEEKNKIITKEIEKEYFESLSFDYPYNHNTSKYYICDKNKTKEEKIEFPLKQTRGKQKGEFLEYPQLLSKTGKWLYESNTDLTY